MADRFAASMIEHHLFPDDGNVSNYPRLPLIVYRGALKANGDGAASCVALFNRNGWAKAWQNGVYWGHHHHSTAREVLASPPVRSV